MKNTKKSFKYFINKYNHELMILFISLFLTTIISIAITAWFQTTNVWIIVNVTIGAVLFVLFIAILFNLRNILMGVFSSLNSQSSTQVFNLLQKTQYRNREKEFTFEKKILADILVEKTLPKIIQKICKENPSVKQLNIILDSGTTITPIFRHLIALGIPKIQDNLKITFYTNNLAGIEELQRADPRLRKLNEYDFILIGGTPLSKYNATIGEATENFLRTIWDEQRLSSGKILTLTITTASWFMGGIDLKNIEICVRGDFHYQNKNDLINNSNYVILITPLARLTRLNDINRLNDLIPDHGENPYSILPIDHRRKIHLLTSFRSQSSLSPLVNLSLQLSSLKTQNETDNYVFCDDCPTYDPDGDKWQVILTDLPFQYIRDKFLDVYHYKFQ